MKRIQVATVLIVALLVACGSPTERTAVAQLSGHVVAGPVCPVETDPPDPNCAPRPVAGAQLSIEAATGETVLVTTDEDGVFRVEIPVGSALVTPQPVEGLLGTPEPFEVEITDAGLDLGTIEYDTGIR